MPTRSRAVDHGTHRGRAIVQKLAGELRGARVDRDLTQDEVSRAVGMSRSRESFIERGLASGVDVVQWSRLLATVGLELSLQVYPSGHPIRDAAQAGLLDRLHARLHRGLRWRTEVQDVLFFPDMGASHRIKESGTSWARKMGASRQMAAVRPAGSEIRRRDGSVPFRARTVPGDHPFVV